MYLRDIPTHLSRLIDSYNSDEVSDEERDAIEMELQQLAERLEDKLDALASVILSGYANIEALTTERKRLETIARSRQASLERLERFVITLIQLSGLSTPINTAHHRLRVGTSTYVCVEDESSISAEWMRVIPERREIDKSELARALKAGNTVKGAALHIRQHLVIK